MKISRKSIFHTVFLISLTIVTLVFGVTYFMDIEDTNVYSKEININEYSEDVNILTINGNINQICDSSKGVCGPPPGWYSTN